MLIIVITAVLANNKNIVNSRVAKDTITAYPVNIAEVKREMVARNADYVGTTVPISDIELLSETQGRVLTVKIANGMKVNRGTLIAQCDDEMMRAQYKLAELALEKTKKDLQRYENLFAEGNYSIADVENARLSVRNADAQFIIAKKSLENTRITSPVSGTLTNRYINTGSTVALGTPIANIVDISRLKVNFWVPEKDIKHIVLNSRVTITTEVNPGKEFFGHVTSAGIKADNAHNYPVEVTLDNANGALNAGMFVKTHLQFTEKEESLVIPRQAFLGSLQEAKVFIVENGIAHARKITVLGSQGESIMVTGDIRAGERVVISGQNNLEEGTQVFIRNAAK